MAEVDITAVFQLLGSAATHMREMEDRIRRIERHPDLPPIAAA